MQSEPRIEALDYLRGLMALAVMAYHYTAWSGIQMPSDSLLSKLGIYAVSIFYILSGLTLAVIYKNKINDINQVYAFFIKRLFRITPLFWVSILTVVALEITRNRLSGEPINFTIYQIFLNISLLFSFLDPVAYMSTGAWSIGNEIVFYTLFPLIIIAASRSRISLPLFFLSSILIGLIFSNVLIDRTQGLVNQWGGYINPLNQLFLFIGGIMIAFYAKHENKIAGAASILLATALFIALPASGDRVNLVTNENRILLSFACMTAVYGFYVSRIKLRSPFNKVFGFLGETCYSIYLLHPIVAAPFAFAAKRFDIDPILAYSAAAAFTIAISYLSFLYIEKPMMRMGSQVAAGVKSQKFMAGNT